MNVIVNADQNWGIGKDNELVIRISADMKMFREKTTGNVIVMGRKTLESFPNQKPLPNRTNVVLTTNPQYDGKGAVIVTTKEEMLEELKKYNSKDIYVVGGGSIYEMLLPYCDTAYVTRTEKTFEADTYFPNLDQLPEWKLVEEGEEQMQDDVIFRFNRYEKA